TVLDAYRQFTESAPEELGLYAEPSVDPDTGERIFVLAFFWPDDLDEGRRILDDLKAAAPPAVDGVEVMPYTAFQQAFDIAFAHGTRYYWKGTLVSSLEPGLLDVVVRHTAELPAPHSTVVFEWYRGPMN